MNLLLQIFIMILLFVYPQQQTNSPLFESIYTETGYGRDENNQPANAGFAQCYYVKIYSDKLIVNTTEYGTGRNIDVEYTYVGKDNEGCRVYERGQMYRYRVDANYDIEHVLSMPIYGGNAWRSTYWQVIKGEKCIDYNKKHKQDGSSLEDRYKQEVLKSQLFDDDGYGY